MHARFVPWLALLAFSACTAAANSGAYVAPQDAATSQDAATTPDTAAAADTAAVDVAAANILAPGAIGGELPDGAELDGAYTLSDDLVVPGGALVKIHAGTTISSPSFGITVHGGLIVQGSKDKTVVVSGPESGAAWAGIHVDGTLQASYLEVSQAVINIQSDASGTLQLDHGWLHHGRDYNALSRGESTLTRMLIEQPRQGAQMTYNLGIKGGTLTLEDSTLRNSPNECILSEGQSHLNVHYNLLDTGHCGIHFNATASADVQHNEMKGDQFGLMIFGLGAGKINGNNFSESVQLEIYSGTGQNAAIDATGNYFADKKHFELGAAQIDTSGDLGAPATDVGPRPEK